MEENKKKKSFKSEDNWWGEDSPRDTKDISQDHSPTASLSTIAFGNLSEEKSNQPSSPSFDPFSEEIEPPHLAIKTGNRSPSNAVENPSSSGSEGDEFSEELEEPDVQKFFRKVSSLFKQMLGADGVMLKSEEEIDEHMLSLGSLKKGLKSWKIDWGAEINWEEENFSSKGKPFAVLVEYYKEAVPDYQNESYQAEVMGAGDILYVVAKYGIDLGDRFTEHMDGSYDIPWLDELFNSHVLLLPCEEKSEPVPVQWVQSLDVKYGRKPTCSSQIFPTEKEHILLEHLTKMPGRDHARLSSKEKGHPNTAHAGISLIVKDTNVAKISADYIRTFYLPLGNEEEARAPKMTSDAAGRVKNRIAKANKFDKNIEEPRFVRPGMKKLDPLIIEDKEEIKKHNLEFRHTEQEIYNFLEDHSNLENLFKDFAKMARELYPSYDDDFSDDIKQLKIVGVILHMHSEKYMCENCQVGGIGFQHSSNFRENLSQVVGSEGINGFFSLNKKKLAFSIFVSTHKVYPLIKKGERPPKPKSGEEVGQHQEGVINIKLLRNEKKFHIFSKDANIGFFQSHSPFYSRYSVALKYNEKKTPLEEKDEKTIEATLSVSSNTSPSHSPLSSSLTSSSLTLSSPSLTAQEEVVTPIPSLTLTSSPSSSTNSNSLLSRPITRSSSRYSSASNSQPLQQGIGNSIAMSMSSSRILTSSNSAAEAKQPQKQVRKRARSPKT